MLFVELDAFCLGMFSNLYSLTLRLARNRCICTYYAYIIHMYSYLLRSCDTQVSHKSTPIKLIMGPSMECDYD